MTVVEIVARLRSERMRRGLTLADIGAALGVSLQQVHAWEFGVHRPRLDSVCRWADALGLDIQLTARPQ